MDIYHFINRPIPRLLRYNLLLHDILKSLQESGAPDDHPDIETIPQVMELIGDLGKATQKGVSVNESKVELWQFQHSLDGGRFGSRAVKDLDLLNPMRELIHRGKVLRQPEGTMSTSWTELTVLLFDNYRAYRASFSLSVEVYSHQSSLPSSRNSHAPVVERTKEYDMSSTAV